MLVREIMERYVLSIPDDATVAEAAQMLRENGASGAPVADESGEIIGVVSRTDITEGWELAAARQRLAFYRDPSEAIDQIEIGDPLSTFAAQRVSQIMMPLVFSVQIGDSVTQAARLMAAEGIHRVIVLDAHRLVGILTASDIVEAVSRGEIAPLS